MAQLSVNPIFITADPLPQRIRLVKDGDPYFIREGESSVTISLLSDSNCSYKLEITRQEVLPDVASHFEEQEATQIDVSLSQLQAAEEAELAKQRNGENDGMCLDETIAVSPLTRGEPRGTGHIKSPFKEPLEFDEKNIRAQTRKRTVSELTPMDISRGPSYARATSIVPMSLTTGHSIAGPRRELTKMDLASQIPASVGPTMERVPAANGFAVPTAPFHPNSYQQAEYGSTMPSSKKVKRGESFTRVIDPTQLQITGVLGTGSCGQVFKATWLGTTVAVKRIFRSLIHDDALKEFYAETNMLKRLRHPNIVLFLGVSTTASLGFNMPTAGESMQDVAIVTEFMSKGSLRDVLNGAGAPPPPHGRASCANPTSIRHSGAAPKAEQVDWLLVLNMALDAAMGINYLHTAESPIIHRDIKSHNMLVDAAFRVKIADLGLAKITSTSSLDEDNTKTFCGTLPWTAPEVFSNSGYSTKADVYSYAIVLWELITRDEPYRSCTKPDIIVGVVNRDLRPELPQYVQDLLQRTPPTLSSGDLCVHGLATIMVACWNRDPNMRPNFQQIIEGLQELKRRVEESLTQEERSTGMDGLAHSDPQPLAPLVLTHQSHQTRDLNDAILARDKSDVVEQIKRSTSSSKSDDSSKPEFTHSWELDVSELTWDQKISETKSATVWKGKYRAQDVAVKVVNENVEGTHLEEFKKEIAVLSSLRSPYMTFFYGCSLSPKLLIVTEFIPGALSLQDLMTKGTQRFDWELVISIALDSAKAINQLHSWRPQVLHRDIKSANLLITSSMAVKVSDLGLARMKTGGNEGSLSKLRGSYLYAAPETYHGEEYTSKCDVFSFGIVLWEMVTRCLTGHFYKPYSEYHNLKYEFQILVQVAKSNLRPTIPSKTPKPLEKLIAQCWDKSASARPSMQEVVEQLEGIKSAYATQQRKKPN